MSSIIERLFGVYTPVSYPVTEMVWDSVNEQFITITNYITPSGAAGVNWSYVAGVGLFAITLYSLFRLIGGVFSRGR